MEDKDDEVLLRGHEDLVTGGLEPQEGQVVGRVEVADYRLGLYWSFMTFVKTSTSVTFSTRSAIVCPY